MGEWAIFRKKPIVDYVQSPCAKGMSRQMTPSSSSGEAGLMRQVSDMFSRAVSGVADVTMDRTLTIWDLIGFEIGSIIGPGIFVTTGLAAKAHAGPSIVISFMLAGLLCVCAGLAYCELAARIPSSGGAYSYAYSALGELPAVLCAALMSLQYFGVASGGCCAAANYINYFFADMGFPLPGLPESWGVSLLAPLQALWLTLVIMRGTEMSTAFSNLVAAANVVMICIFIVTGLSYSEKENWTNDFNPNGFAGILSGTSVVFYAFNGFDACSTLAEEVPSPEVLIPRGLLGALVIVTTAYIGIGLALTGMVPWTELDDFAPFAAACVRHQVTWAFYMITFSAVLNCWASAFASIVAQPRLLFAIAKDGLLPAQFKKLDPVTKTPLWGTVFTGCCTAFMSATLDFATLSMTVSCGILFVYVFTGVGLLLIRYDQRVLQTDGMKRAFNIALSGYVTCVFCSSQAFHLGYSGVAIPFGVLAVLCAGFFVFLRVARGEGTTSGAAFLCPFMPFLPLVSIVVNTHVALSLGLKPLRNVLVFLAFSAVGYFAHGAKHSKLNFSQSLRKSLMDPKKRS